MAIEGMMRVVMGCYLGIAAVSDIRKGLIQVKWMLLCGILLVPLQTAGILWEDKVFAGQLMGAAFGGLFLLIACATGEAVGYADGWSIVLLGLYFGLQAVVFITCLSLAAAAAYSGILLCLKRVHKKSVFPFLPFLAGAFILWCLLD